MDTKTALAAGIVLGALKTAGMNVSPLVDADGNYTNAFRLRSSLLSEEFVYVSVSIKEDE